jgi:formate hydrogenlyase subunit 4
MRQYKVVIGVKYLFKTFTNIIIIKMIKILCFCLVVLFSKAFIPRLSFQKVQKFVVVHETTADFKNGMTFEIGFNKYLTN